MEAELVSGTEVKMLGDDDETREDMVGVVEVNTPEHTGISGVV